MAFRVLAKKDMELCESPVIEHDFSLRPLCQLREDKVCDPVWDFRRAVNEESHTVAVALEIAPGLHCIGHCLY
ncbi:unnamed protein product [Symbiodinium pilosum]|uniref:Uncharacterized protein n=1 Tax=Symbiodinium pilosum TaxID=2952 RepID=A0A812LAJ8_SYMPI|nr:unnamed protein product [Symbiodinium pilosum]